MATAYAKTLDQQWLDSRCRGHTVRAEKITLTPSMAAELLARNPDNRTISQPRVAVYASDIAEGRWTLNGEPVIVSRDGFLNDGQHRCAAVVETGIPIETVIVFGVERESRRTTNQGKSKGAGDYAAMDGVPNGNVVAAIARMVICYRETGDIKLTGRVSNARTLEFIEANRDGLISAMRTASCHAKKIQPLVSVSPFSFAYYICREINAAAADEYYAQVATGEGLAANDPALVVRNKLLQLGKASRQVKTEILLHGWNSYRKGEARHMMKTTGNLPKII